MRDRAPLTSFALAAALLCLLPACEAWECGYGGPGCSPPTLTGVCDDTDADVSVTFFDDTGRHPTDVYAATSSAPEVLEASVVEQRLVLTVRAEGRVDVTVESLGFDDVAHVFELTVDADGVGAADAMACAGSGLGPSRTVAVEAGP